MSDKSEISDVVASRIIGVILSTIGICLTWVFRNEYYSGSAIFSTKLLFMTPLILLTGLAYLLVPRIPLALMHSSEANGTKDPEPSTEQSTEQDDKQDVPPQSRFFYNANFLIFLIGLVLGIYVRYFVFKDWN